MTPKIALLGFLFVSFYVVFMTFFCLAICFIFCSVSSLLIGSFGALAQKNKTITLYSSIGHVGYLLMGLCCGTVEGLHAVLLYLVLYVFMTINIFAIILSSIDHAKTNRVKYIQDLGFLGQTHPVLAVTLSATLFSMAGIPPLAGFCSKFYLFFCCNEFIII